MLVNLMQQFNEPFQNLMLFIMIINALVHVIFAGAVARDAGELYKLGQRPALVSGGSWAFATLIGGVVIAGIYWFIHHSTLTRPIVRSEKN